MKNGDKLTVLVVDDDVFFLKSIIIGLDRKYQHSVNFKYFFNTTDLYSQLKSNACKVDLILLDYNMNSSISGIDLLQKIKAFNPLFDIVMVSSQKNLQTVFSTIKSGARNYIQKNNNVIKGIQKCIDDKIETRKREERTKKVKTIAVIIVPIIFALLIFIKYTLIK